MHQGTPLAVINMAEDPGGREIPLVEIRDLVKYFPVKGGALLREVASVKAVDGVSLTIPERQTMGLVGESGCGKSTLGFLLLRLLDPTAGEVLYRGRSEEHTSELQSHSFISYAVFCLKKKNK